MVKVTGQKMQKGDRMAGVSYALYRVLSLQYSARNARQHVLLCFVVLAAVGE